jgi:hypothetical protein
MKESQEVTVRHLTSDDADLRLAALTLVIDYWPAREHFAGPVMRLAMDDPVSAIRGAALAALRMLRQFVADPTGSLSTVLNFAVGGVTGRAADELRGALERAKRALDDAAIQVPRALAGAALPRLLESREAAEGFLHDEDPNLRRAAIFVLSNQFGPPSADLLTTCERLLSEDPAVAVRATALDRLAASHRGTDDPRLGQLFARIVRDERQPTDLRVQAYLGLRCLRGIPMFGWFRPGSRPNFPEMVDWDFVKGFIPDR